MFGLQRDYDVLIPYLQEPTRITPDWNKRNEELVLAFLQNPSVVAVMKHIQSEYTRVYSSSRDEALTMMCRLLLRMGASDGAALHED